MDWSTDNASQRGSRSRHYAKLIDVTFPNHSIPRWAAQCFQTLTNNMFVWDNNAGSYVSSNFDGEDPISVHTYICRCEYTVLAYALTFQGDYNTSTQRADYIRSAAQHLLTCGAFEAYNAFILHVRSNLDNDPIILSAVNSLSTVNINSLSDEALSIAYQYFHTNEVKPGYILPDATPTPSYDTFWSLTSSVFRYLRASSNVELSDVAHWQDVRLVLDFIQMTQRFSPLFIPVSASDVNAFHIAMARSQAVIDQEAGSNAPTLENLNQLGSIIEESFAGVSDLLISAREELTNISGSLSAHRDELAAKMESLLAHLDDLLSGDSGASGFSVKRSLASIGEKLLSLKNQLMAHDADVSNTVSSHANTIAEKVDGLGTHFHNLESTFDLVKSHCDSALDSISELARDMRTSQDTCINSNAEHNVQIDKAFSVLKESLTTQFSVTISILRELEVHLVNTYKDWLQLAQDTAKQNLDFDIEIDHHKEVLEQLTAEVARMDVFSNNVSMLFDKINDAINLEMNIVSKLPTMDALENLLQGRNIALGVSAAAESVKAAVEAKKAFVDKKEAIF